MNSAFYPIEKLFELTFYRRDVTRAQNQIQTLSFLRPFARRLLMTLRPLAVAMRARKPCVRLRLILLG